MMGPRHYGVHHLHSSPRNERWKFRMWQVKAAIVKRTRGGSVEVVEGGNA